VHYFWSDLRTIAKQAGSHSNESNATIQELLKVVFSMLSLPRGYQWDKFWGHLSNPVPEPPCSCGIWIQVPGPPGCEGLESERAQYFHESRGTRTWEWLRWRGPAATVNDKPILSSERMLHKDYEIKCSVGKQNYCVVSVKELVAKTNWLAVNCQS
jgi:hypothetical protein